jgi:hypothetical protein
LGELEFRLNSLILSKHVDEDQPKRIEYTIPKGLAEATETAVGHLRKRCENAGWRVFYTPDNYTMELNRESSKFF